MALEDSARHKDIFNSQTSRLTSKTDDSFKRAEFHHINIYEKNNIKKSIHRTDKSHISLHIRSITSPEVGPICFCFLDSEEKNFGGKGISDKEDGICCRGKIEINI